MIDRVWQIDRAWQIDPLPTTGQIGSRTDNNGKTIALSGEMKYAIRFRKTIHGLISGPIIRAGQAGGSPAPIAGRLGARSRVGSVTAGAIQ